jgi:phage replication initiation protein
MDALFYTLPQSLQDRILPPAKKFKLSPAAQAKKAAMEATIEPKKYVSRVASLGVGVSGDAGAARASAQAVPPFTNRGGKSSANGPMSLPSWEAKEYLKIVSLGAKGKFQKVAIPLPDKSKNVRHSFVDWVNFTFKVGNFSLSLPSGHPAITDKDYVEALSVHLFNIFGYGVTSQRESGMNFYKSSFDLGYHGWGLVCIGGQQDTVLVTVKGQGLMSASPGWEYRLYQFLLSVKDAKLTRVDLASDNFHSKTSMDDYLAMYHAGLFVNRGRAPNIEQVGNWIKPTGKGRTLYIGNRKSGKLLRIYEKGLQLANGFHEKYPDWIRVELELKNDDRVIPFDCLLRPGQYLAGAYPALANMHKIQTRIDTFKKTVESTFERAVEVTRHQFGKYIYTICEILGAEEAIKVLTEGKQELPKRLNFDTFAQYAEGDYIHSLPTKTYESGVIPL